MFSNRYVNTETSKNGKLIQDKYLFFGKTSIIKHSMEIVSGTADLVKGE